MFVTQGGLPEPKRMEPVENQPSGSQYLDRVPLSKAKARYCYYCNIYMQRHHGRHDRHQDSFQTSDHILPRSIGKIPTGHGAGRIRVTRSCCSGCNQVRAAFGHCTGVLMIAIMEGERLNLAPKSAAVAIGMYLSRRQRKRRRRERMQLDKGFQSA